MGIAFRHTAGFGKRMEYRIVGDMLMEGLDCYLPLVDDHGVDCVIKKQDGTFIEIQIKARSREVAFGDAALFAAIDHSETPNFYFIFYSERMDTMWIISSQEFFEAFCFPLPAAAALSQLLPPRCIRKEGGVSPGGQATRLLPAPDIF